jgi:competence ComEA-like helix-hairpin-helix protein
MPGHPLTRLFLTAILLLCATTATTKKPPTHPININTAQSAELPQVPGIGPSTAEKILQTRKSYGSFKTVDDLLSIRGIGPKRLEKMRKYWTAGKPGASRPGKPATFNSAKPAACGNCAKAAPVAKSAVSPPQVKPSSRKTPAEPVASDDEEPE